MGARKSVTTARFSQFLQPTVDAIKDLGGSARPSEVKEWILKHSTCPLTDEGRRTRIDADLASKILRSVENRVASDATIASAESNSLEDSQPYIEKTLQRIRSLPPKGFENLCQRLLRESGFEEVDVTGRSGDGGIDGHGILKLNAFVSFRVLFQCKRYKESVGPSTIRDFRGAMAGRAEKGLVLTTGYFTPQAEAEASRDGAQPIELVDGENLVRLLADLELGLKPIQSYELDEHFFQQFEVA